MAPKIERILENFALSEGPHWDEDTQSLYFVDIVNQIINKYVPATKKLTTAATGAHVSFIIPVKGQNNTFIISREREVRVITWDGETDNFSVVRKFETTANSSVNDGKCDSTGRLWTGTLGLNEENVLAEELGHIYSIEKDKITKVADNIAIPNGLAFNKELKKFYYIDSHKKTIDAYDWDIEQGTIKNCQPIFTLETHDIPGIADGMTIDTDGNLWVAIYNGSRVIQIDPRKPETLLCTVPLPAQQPTSIAFGGENLDELYVTTALLEYGTTEKLLPPVNGAVYRITGLGFKGYPGESFVL
ncbi:regucalcin [Anoplophora glabripennis]|nr:regucalcin [Anoplophora glabripennis]